MGLCNIKKIGVLGWVTTDVKLPVGFEMKLLIGVLETNKGSN